MTRTFPSSNDLFEHADPITSRRLLDQHDVVINACGDKLLQFPFDFTKPNLKILESGTADGTSSKPPCIFTASTVAGIALT